MELIKTEMTPKERVTAYNRGEEVDRIPTNLSANETIPPLYGYSMKDYYFSSDVMVEVETRLAEDFHADNMGIGLGLRSLVEALGSEMTYKEKDVAFISKPAFKKAAECENRDLVNIDQDGRLPIIVEAIAKLLDQFGQECNIGSGLAGPLTTAASLMGTENFLRATVKDKENLHKLMQFTTDNVVKCCKDMNERLGIKFSLSEPLASKNLLSKRQFKEFFLPYLEQAVERMNEFQGGTGIHICGQTRDRWDEVINAGVSGFWVDNCESLKELKDLYGDRVSISGNLPPVDVLRNGSVEEMEAAVKKCLLEAADAPLGYRLCPGCTTPIGTSKESMISFMNAAYKYGRGARKGQMPKALQ